jgi:hypothetical protein
MAGSPLALTRDRILSFRRRAGALEERLPHGARSLRRAAWAGLTDSIPRSALLSIHARVDGTQADGSVDPWLTRAGRDAVEVAAHSLPLPGVERDVAVRWSR